MVPRNKTSLPRLHLMLTHSLPDFECQNKLAMFQTFSALYGKSRYLQNHDVFCSNIAPSLSSRNHLFYKAENTGQSVTELPELGFVHNFRLHWGALATWIKLLWTAFWQLLSGIPHLLGFGYMPGAGTWYLNFQVPGALCKVTGKVSKWYPWKGLSKCSSEMLIWDR